jgi:hypothetical protein
MPKRIQLRRTKGWRKPKGAVVVSRPSKWGNPFVIWTSEIVLDSRSEQSWWCPRGEARGFAVRRFREELMDGRLSVTPDDVVKELRGHDLACWCKPHDPCHADVLLGVANA